MRATIFLLLLAGGAEGRKALFGQTEGDSNKCGAACEWFASAPVDGNDDAQPQTNGRGSASKICPPSHEMVWVLTGYDGNQWTKLEQYLMPGVTCQGSCPLTLKQRRDAGAPGWCH